MKNKYHALIVGAGPSGATAAYTLANKGLKVAIFDKVNFPREKLCGGLITLKTLEVLNKVYSLSLKELINNNIIISNSSYFSIFYNKKLIQNSKTKIPFYFINRKKFDDFLLNKAIKAGATFYPNTSIKKCDHINSTLTTFDNSIFKADYIIGADGANSQIRKSIITNNKLWKKNLASTIEISFPQHEFPYKVDRPQIHIGEISKGYFWIFPAKNKVIAGIGSLNCPKFNMKKAFIDFLKDQGVENFENIKFKGHPLPYGNYLKQPHKNNTILCGDAGGLVEPLFGEGIFYALQTAKYVADSIVEAESKHLCATKLYQQKLNKNIFPEFKYSNKLRWALHYLKPILHTLTFTIAFSSLRNKLVEMVHGKRSYKFLIKKHWE